MAECAVKPLAYPERAPQMEPGTDYIFAGGDGIGAVGGIIDVNGNGLVDDGDYTAGEYDYTLNGNSTVTLTF